MKSNFKAQFPINKMLRIKLKNKPYLKKKLTRVHLS